METSARPQYGSWQIRFAGVIEAARRRARRRRVALLALLVAVAAVGWFASRSLGHPSTGPSTIAPRQGLTVPGMIGPTQGWYVRAVGTMTSPGLIVGARHMTFESLQLANGEVLTRWTPAGHRLDSQNGLMASGLDGLQLPLPGNARALIGRIHQVPVWRSPDQTFAALEGVLTSPTAAAVHRAALNALLLVPGAHAAPGRDELGRMGRRYSLGDQSVVIVASTGAVLGFSNPVLQESFTGGQLVPKCVIQQRSRTEFNLPAGTPRTCFLDPSLAPVPRSGSGTGAK